MEQQQNRNNYYSSHNREETKFNRNGNPSYPSTQKYGFHQNDLPVYKNYVENENYDDWETSQNPSNQGKRGKWSTEQVIYNPDAPNQGTISQEDGQQGHGFQGKRRGNRGRGGGYRGRGGYRRGTGDGSWQGTKGFEREGNNQNRGENASEHSKEGQQQQQGWTGRRRKNKNKNNNNNNGNNNNNNYNNSNNPHYSANNINANNSQQNNPQPRSYNNNKPSQQHQHNQNHKQKQKQQQQQNNGNNPQQNNPNNNQKPPQQHQQQQNQNQHQQQNPNKNTNPSNGLALGMTIEQFKAFQEQYAELMKQLEEHKDKPEKFQLLTKQYERRMAMAQKQAQKNLPIYPKRKEIMDHFLKNKFTIVVGDTGCGKSTQLPQYMFEHYEQIPGSKILWVLPRKLPVLSLSQRVCEEMEVQIGNEVGFEIPNKKKCFPNTLLKFTTDTLLINELIDKRARVGPEGKIKLDYSLIVLDEVHERNLYTDILLTTLKEIALDTDMKLLVTSATINEALFEHYFNTKAIQVKGRPYPVDITYNPIVDAYKAIDHVTNVIFNITRDMKKVDYEYRGHILVFTSGVDDIIKIKTKLIEEKQLNLDKFDVLPLHGLLAPDEQQAIFQDTKKYKVILSTRIAETALTIDGVRVVIDIGYDKETIYDSIKRMTIIENKPIPQSSAIQRAGRAGRTSPGMCVRLYSIEDFTKMEKNKISEIQRMNLGTVILKLKAIGVSELRKFDFIEKPNEQVLVQTIEHLKELDALDRNTEELTLTGQAMLKLETDPDFSKVILEGLKRNCAKEVIDIIAMIGVNPRLYNRGYDDDKREAADKKKLGFCHEKGDLLTLLDIYTYWSNRSKPERKKWCTTNYFSYYALNEAYKTTKDLDRNMDVVKVIYKGIQARTRLAGRERNQNQDQNQNQNQPVNAGDAGKEKEDNILKCFLSAFYTNVCQYTNYPKIGYTLLRDGTTLRLHGASSVALAQDYPEYLFCIDINKTTFTNSKLVSVIQEDWFEELFPNYMDNPRTNFLSFSYTFSSCTIPCLSKLLLKNLAYKDSALKARAEELKITFCPELDQEQLHAYSSALDEDELSDEIDSIIRNLRADLQNETKEIPITLKTRAIFKEGGEVQEILCGDRTRALRIKGLGFYGDDYDEESIKNRLMKYGTLLSISFEKNKITRLRDCVVIMKSYRDVSKILKDAHVLSRCHLGAETIKPIEYEVTERTRRSLRLTIEWSVGRCEGDSLLIFQDEDTANHVYYHLLNDKHTINGICVKEVQYRQKTRHICMRRVKDKKNILFQNVPDSIDETDLRSLFDDWSLSWGLEKVIKFRQDDYSQDSKDEVIAVVHDGQIRSMINSLGVKDTQILRIEADKRCQYQQQAEYGKTKKTTHKNYRRKIFVDVLDIEVAKKILGYFDNNSDIPELTKEKTRCTLSLSTGFNLELRKYKLVEQEIAVIVDELRNMHDGIKVFLDERVNFFDKRLKEMSIRIVAKDLMTLDQCSEALDSVLLGAPFYLSTLYHAKKMEEPKTQKDLAQIKRNHSVSIDYIAKRRMLKVFGPEDNRQAALDHLATLFNNGPDLGHTQVKVSFKYKSVRHIFENNEALLQQVRNLCGVKIDYMLRTKEFAISGPAAKVSDAESRIVEMVNMSLDCDRSTDNDCPICNEPVLEGFRLQVCGHKFCLACLEAELSDILNDNPSFPLCCPQCHNQDQQSAICLKDLEHIFTEEMKQIMWERSVDAYISDSKKYKRCPTKKCPQVYRRDEQNIFSCDYCLQSYRVTCRYKYWDEDDDDYHKFSPYQVPAPINNSVPKPIATVTTSSNYSSAVISQPINNNNQYSVPKPAQQPIITTASSLSTNVARTNAYVNNNPTTYKPTLPTQTIYHSTHSLPKPTTTTTNNLQTKTTYNNVSTGSNGGINNGANNQNTAKSNPFVLGVPSTRTAYNNSYAYNGSTGQAAYKKPKSDDGGCSLI